MIAFIELTIYRTEMPVFIRADHIVSVVVLPATEPREAGLGHPAVEPRVVRLGHPERTLVVLNQPGDTWEGMTRPAQYQVTETAEQVMGRIHSALLP